MLQLKYIAQRAYEGDFKKIWKSWNTCAGELKGEKPRWVIDIDDKELASIKMSDFLSTIEPIGNKIVASIPTKNGFHLITTPFNIKKFKEKYPDIDVHKNNPTVLYIP